MNRHASGRVKRTIGPERDTYTLNPSPGSYRRSGGESGAVAIIMAQSVLHHHSIVLCHHAHN